MTRFQDCDGQIILEKNGRGISISRAKFTGLEPGYSLPQGIKIRYYDGNVQWVKDFDGNQSLALDVPNEALDGYLSKIPEYMQATRYTDVGSPGQQNAEDYDHLASMLRGTAVWSTMFAAMGIDLKANAAGTMVLQAINGTKNLGDLQAGYAALLAAMQANPDIPGFSPNEINFIKESLNASGFNPVEFGL